MTNVRIADLKARLNEYLRRVRPSDVLTVFNRRTPIARIVKVEVDVVALLLEERQGGR